MLTMLKLDLVCLRGQARQVLLMTALLGALFVVSMGPVGAVAAVTVLMPMWLMNALYALDGDGGWQELRLAMPLTRGQVIAGRYLTGVAAVAAGALAGLVVCGVVYVVRESMAPYADAGWAIAEFDVSVWVMAGALFAGVCIALLMQAFTMPFVARFGFTRAVRFVPFLFVALGLVLMWAVRYVFALVGAGRFAWFTSLAAGGLTDGVFPAGSYDLSLVLVACVAALVVLALYAASCALSRWLYARREF